MYVIEDKGGAIALMLAALFFLGTWPAVLTLLERRGRLPQHTYLDYSMTNLLAAVFIALTFGQIGESKPNMPNFFTQLTQVGLRNLNFWVGSFVFTVITDTSWSYSCSSSFLQDNWPSILFAMAGGIVLSLGNLATQYAWAFVGLSVTEVITSSITVVIGIHFHMVLSFSPSSFAREDQLLSGVFEWQEQLWTIFSTIESIELRYFSLELLAFSLLSVSGLLFIHQMQLITTRSSVVRQATTRLKLGTSLYL